MKKTLTLIALLALSANLMAQKDKTYTSMEVALENPSLVYNLDLSMTYWGMDDQIFMEDLNSMASFVNLEMLVLAGNELTTIPESISKLKSLKMLDLQDNQLVTLPDGIGELSNLEELDLQSNKIDRLPESLEGLTALWFLDLRQNNLSKMPSSFNLPLLTVCLLDVNKFSEFPVSIYQSKNLNILGFSLNPIIELPHELAQMPVINWLLYSEDAKENNKDLIKMLKKKKGKFEFSWIPDPGEGWPMDGIAYPEGDLLGVVKDPEFSWWLDK